MGNKENNERQPDGFVSGEYFVSINDYNANSCFRTNEWKPVYFSPQVVKDGFEKWLEKEINDVNSDYSDVISYSKFDIKKSLVDVLSEYRKFSPQVSPSDEEIKEKLSLLEIDILSCEWGDANSGQIKEAINTLDSN